MLRTGAAYAAALRDGRTVWHAGARIANVTTHPGFAGTVRTLAALYDRQHAPEDAPTMTAVRNGERISCSYLPPATLDELRAKRRNIELWSERTFGLMGRFPEFCSELVVGLLDFAGVLERANRRWAANARAYYEHCAGGDLCLTHALNDQYYDRTKRAGEQDEPDLILHVVRETEDGPIVRGLRTLATLAPLADEVIVFPNRPRDADEPDYALGFAIPIATPGLHVVCRDLYAERAERNRLPLTTRFDEVDAALIFDDVLVPWERLFFYRDPAVGAIFHRGVNRWAGYSTLVRLVVRLESYVGVAHLLAQRSTSSDAPALLGRLIADTEIVRACVQAAEANAVPTAGGLVAPTVSAGYRLAAIEASDRAHETLRELLAEQYADGAGERVPLLGLAADMVHSPFGMRGQLYERLQSGEPESIRRRLYGEFKETAPVERVRRFLAASDVGSPAPNPRELSGKVP